MNEQFTNETSLSVSFVIETAAMSFADYVQAKKKAVQAIGEERPLAEELTFQSGAVMVRYATPSQKRHRFVCLSKGADGFLKVDFMQTRPEALDGDLDVIQQIIDSIVYK